MMYGSKHLISLPKVYAALEHVLDTIRIAGGRDWCNVDGFGLQVTQVLTLLKLSGATHVSVNA